MDPEAERGELAAWLEEQRGRDLSDDEVEAAARRLAAVGGVALDLVLAHLQSPDEDPALLAISSQALRVWEPPYPVEPLLGLLGNRKVGALPKALVLRLLEGYGMETRELLAPGINLEEYEVRRDDDDDGA
jgi:hypothetical protein